jgi:dTDP-glucose 4,6-dehydratase
MNILIYGSNGWIGQQFIKELDKLNINYIESNLRVDDTQNVINEIDMLYPTHVLSLIGRTHGIIEGKEYTTIDYLEQEGKLIENIRDNLFCPITLSKICNDRKIHFTYLGTGCIFEYDDKHLQNPKGFLDDKHLQNPKGFLDSDLPNFTGSSYSIVKGFTDRLMHLYDDSVLNLRIRMPINGDVNKRNFIYKITTYEKICSIENSMTVLPELIPIAIDMMINKITGTINLTNPGVISHNEILEMYKEIVDPNFKWTNFTIEEQSKILASKRSNNYLDTSKLQSLYPDVKGIKESVRNVLYEYKNNYMNLQNIPNNVLLVTGGCGFIGSNFINQISEIYDKIKIVNIDAMYYCADEENIKFSIRYSPNYTFINGNICDLQLIQYVLNEYNITHVIHFAAQSHVENSFEKSLQYTNDNILGTHTLLEACRIYGKIRKFIHISTDEVYGESENDDSKTEQSLLCPTNPYAATKAGAELIAQSYIRSFKMPILITRGNNVYGPNQYPEKLIPKFIKQLKDNEKVTIQGDGSNLRSFLHVDDTVNAFILLLEKGVIGEIYNIGADVDMEYSVLDVAKILIGHIKETDDYDEWITYIPDRPFNDKRYLIDNEKIKNLGWIIKIDFKDGIQSLIA